MQIATRKPVRKLGYDRISFQTWGVVASIILCMMGVRTVCSEYKLVGWCFDSSAVLPSSSLFFLGSSDTGFLKDVLRDWIFLKYYHRGRALTRGPKLSLPVPYEVISISNLMVPHWTEGFLRNSFRFDILFVVWCFSIRNYNLIGTGVEVVQFVV